MEQAHCVRVHYDRHAYVFEGFLQRGIPLMLLFCMSFFLETAR